jgi:hypothetical protein
MFGWSSLRSRPVSDGNLTLWRHTTATEPGGAGAIDEGLAVSPLVAGVLAGALAGLLAVGGPPPEDVPEPPLDATTPMTAAMIAARTVAPAPIQAPVLVLRVAFESSLDMR